MLAQSLNTSGFPTYLDGCKTCDDFEAQVRSTFADSNKTLLMYEADGAAHVCFLEEQDGNDPALMELGFQRICRYVGYTAQL